MLRETVIATATMTSMIFVILFGAAVFSIVFRMMGGDNLVHEFLLNMPGGALGATIIVMLVMFLLGLHPRHLRDHLHRDPDHRADPARRSVSIRSGSASRSGVNLQTSFLTPPFGFSLFYLRGVAPARVTTGMIYKGVVPFVILQLVGLADPLRLAAARHLAAGPRLRLTSKRPGGRPGPSRSDAAVAYDSLKYFSRAARNGMSVPSVRVRSTLNADTKLSATFLGQRVAVAADLGQQFRCGLGARLEDLVGEPADLSRRAR